MSRWNNADATTASAGAASAVADTAIAVAGATTASADAAIASAVLVLWTVLVYNTYRKIGIVALNGRGVKSDRTQRTSCDGAAATVRCYS